MHSQWFEGVDGVPVIKKKKTHVPISQALRLSSYCAPRVFFLLRTTRMHSQQLGGVNSVAVIINKNKRKEHLYASSMTWGG